MKTPSTSLCVFMVGLLTLSCFAHDPPRAVQRAEPPGATYEGRAFHFYKIREDVFHAVGTGELDVICNSTIIINEQTECLF